MHSKHIQIIPHTLQIHPSIISEVINTPEIELRHGNTFTGKPSTQLHTNQDYVLKCRKNLNFSTENLAFAWGKKQFEKDQNTKLYHPKKTWFVAPTQQGWTVGNISPRLTPLNLAFEQPNCSTEDKLLFLSQLTQIYLAYGATFKERLDEGLSNFGLDQNNHLYYLDDDFYQWDHLLSFANMVALWVRLFSSSWLDDTAAQKLGETLKQQVQQLFMNHTGVDYVSALPEHLKQQFFNEIGRERVNKICAAILSQESTSETASNPLKEKHRPLSHHIETWLHDDAPIAMISDIHANLPAFDAVLNDIQQQSITHILCMGDIVGYGPHPSACIQRLQDLNVFVIRGNHDHMVGSGKDFSHGSQSSLHVAKWTINTISQDEKKWLRELPLQYRSDDTMLVHGAPRDATFFNAYVYERTAEPNLRWMEEHNVSLCFHGHSHLQGLYTLKSNQVSFHKKLQTYVLEGSTANLICPGAVGQPRSGNSGAEYAIYHPKTKTITFKRLPYNISAVTKDMKAQGFPHQLITRLEEGF